ncbi:hypothetical protein [Nocardia gipuzkoensis]
MDPVTLVAAAIAAGAAAGVTDTTKKMVGDAYEALKRVLTRRYKAVGVDVAAVEQQPASQQSRQKLIEDLAAASADKDEELLTAARDLLRVIREQAPEAAESVGVRFARVKAGEADIDAIDSAGSIVFEDIDVGGTMKVHGLRAGVQQPPHPPTARE